jgi:hypothetical protein
MTTNPNNPPLGNSAVLADAALRYCVAGWPVLPTRLPAPTTTPDLSLKSLVSHRPPADTRTAQQWWQDRPYGIAAIVGIHFDILVVPADHGPTVTDHLLTNTTVAAADHPGGWWLLLVTAAADTLTDLPRRSGITLLRAGTYIPLPPTPTAHGPVEWARRTTGLADLIRPGPTGLPRLPHSLTAQQAAARAVRIHPNRNSSRGT